MNGFKALPIYNVNFIDKKELSINLNISLAIFHFAIW